VNPPVNRKRGRPVGSRTFQETPAMKRARDFIDLLSDGIKPTQAARRVANQWMVVESTVYKDFQRHQARIFATQTQATRKRMIDLGRRFQADYPEHAGELLAMSESVGVVSFDTETAAAAKSFYETERGREMQLELLGECYLAILRRRGNTTGG
jgi:hypothetical protein